MSAISRSSEFSDVLNDGYVAGSVSVSTTAIELKVGATRLDGREEILIENKGPFTIYIGPSGVTTSTGTTLHKDQTITMPIGQDLGVFAITATGTSIVVVQEIG